MCGIVGALSNGANADPSVIQNLAGLMSRRGPDDEGYWHDNGVSLGFRRLAVLDPTSSGHQPMLSGDGRYVLLFNGEVYNFQELRDDLGRRGLSFRSRTDTEVVLQALVQWGEGALPRLNGIFALAFYDSARRRLLLARDPIGVKPLYYLDSTEGVVFASQYDQIMRHPWAAGHRLDDDALRLFLRLGYVPAPHAMFERSYMVEPGCYVDVREGRARQHRFYTLPAPPVHRLPSNVAISEAEDVLGAAVRRQLVSDVPLGVFLSGGVDSPLVAALAQEHSGSQLDAVTVSTADRSLDESAEAATVAAAVGLRHFVREAHADDAVSLVQRHSAAFAEPFADHSSIPTMLVSEAARERLTVALSGDGGDELFFGYPRFRKVLSTEQLFRWPRPARVGRYAAGRLGVASAVPAGVRYRTVGDWYLRSHSYWSDHHLALAAPSAANLPDEFDLYDPPSGLRGDALADWLRENEIRGHLQRVLLKVDRASMYHSLEVRVPLLDLEVVEFAMRVSPSACMTERGDKAVLRELLSKRVSPAIASLPKRGFTVPVGDWLRGPLRPLVHDLLLGGRAHPEGLFDQAGLQRLYADHLTGRDNTLPLWTALVLQLWWHDHYARRRVPAS